MLEVRQKVMNRALRKERGTGLLDRYDGSLWNFEEGSVLFQVYSFIREYRLTEDDLRALMNKFELIDKDFSGTIDYKGRCRACAKCAKCGSIRLACGRILRYDWGRVVVVH